MESLLIWLLIGAGLILGIWLYFKFFKVPKMNALVMITGGVKAGKSTFAVASCIQLHKRKVFITKIKNFFFKLFKKLEIELPLLYSNIPLNYPYVLITDDLLLRNKRFVYGSVVYLGEMSLVANSQNFQNMELNERLLLFHKLCGHELRGGTVIVDTQCIQDVHFSVKRSISQNFFVHHTYAVPLLPFVIVYVREFTYTEDSSVVNTIGEDTEESLKRVVIWKNIWKKFDSYCYSRFTDDLPVERTVIDEKKDDLRAFDILSFNKYTTIQLKGEEEKCEKGQ